MGNSTYPIVLGDSAVLEMVIPEKEIPFLDLHLT